MICPKCQKEVSDTAKFCTKCGCNLEKEMARQTVTPVPPQMTCAKCGAGIKPGTKFCTKCGTPVPEVKPTPVPEVKSSPMPQADIASSAGKAEKTKKKSGKGFVIAFIVLVLLAAAGAAGFLVYNGMIEFELPIFLDNDNMEDVELVEDSDAEETDSMKDSEAEDVDADVLFAEVDALLAEGKEKTAIDAEVVNGMESIEGAIGQFVEKAEEAGSIGIAQERIADAHAAYVSAVLRHKDMLNGQTLSGNVYSQILSEMAKAEGLADELSGKGIRVEVFSLETAKEEFISQYTDRMIAAFDEFTEREMWSRTEAWNLMVDADKMFGDSEEDNPIRLRYAYALSWWIQKQIETELNNGVITKKGAAIKIANSIKDMDYNPMMISYYIYYMNASGEDCAEVEVAYDKIVSRIYETQGIRIGQDFDLEHFWYFNDFGEYSVDDTNGVTTENRQWIRSYMENIDFIKN